MDGSPSRGRKLGCMTILTDVSEVKQYLSDSFSEALT
jgi:hypothetical protein